MAILNIRNLTVRFATATGSFTAVDGVSFTLERGQILGLVGESGSGKSTIANLVEKKLFAMGRHTYLLDGDNVRHGLNRDLGFTDADRVENVRRLGEVARLMTDAGLIAVQRRRIEILDQHSLSAYLEAAA